MQRTRLLLIAAVAAVALAAAPSDAFHMRGCRPAHSKTMAASRVARVYRLYDRHDKQTYVWGCLYSKRTSYFLAIDNPRDPYDVQEWVPRVVLRGRFAAIVAQSKFRSDNTSELWVWDLRRGRTVHAWVRYGEREEWTVPDLVLRPNGYVAWIAADQVDGSPPSYVVFKAATTHHGRGLDYGDDIEPGSLELHAGVLSWRRGGETRTAPLR